jgi:hypothetical protein
VVEVVEVVPVGALVFAEPIPSARSARRKTDGRTCGVVVFVTVTAPLLAVSIRMFPVAVAGAVPLVALTRRLRVDTAGELALVAAVPFALMPCTATAVPFAVVFVLATRTVEAPFAAGATLVMVAEPEFAPLSSGDVPSVGVAMTFPDAAGAATRPLPT